MGRAKVDPQKYRPVINNGFIIIIVESLAYHEYWD